jgi:pimeloyl-ACP methyl ester carboxylesterase
LGGKVAVEYAVRYPEQVSRLVLLCPSGLSAEERLPVVEGIRRSDLRGLVESVFHDPCQADPRILEYYQKQFTNRRWRSGLLRTIRGTIEHRVVGRLAEIAQPTLVIVGEQDRVVDPQQAIDAVRLLPQGKLVVLPQCGHAPQIEQADLINRLVVEFLTETDEGHAAEVPGGQRP